MISSRALVYQDSKTASLLERSENETPFGIQLFGNDPKVMGKAAEIAVARTDADFIDINMGCPAPKITGNGAGSALMKDTDLAAKIAETVVKNANGTPVSVKMRKGWDDDCISCVELAKKVEAVGVNFITVHGRTRKQMYAPPVDFDTIKAVKKAVKIPVIGMGGVATAEDVIEYIMAGATAVEVGAANLVNPYVCKEIIEELPVLMQELGIESLSDIVGKAHV